MIALTPVLVIEHRRRETNLGHGYTVVLLGSGLSVGMLLLSGVQITGCKGEKERLLYDTAANLCCPVDWHRQEE